MPVAFTVAPGDRHGADAQRSAAHLARRADAGLCRLRSPTASRGFSRAPLGEVALRVLPGTEGARYPFWSADSRQVAFFADGRLKALAVGGGEPRAICEAPFGQAGAWGDDGVILFPLSARGGLLSRADGRRHRRARHRSGRRAGRLRASRAALPARRTSIRVPRAVHQPRARGDLRRGARWRRAATGAAVVERSVVRRRTPAVRAAAGADGRQGGSRYARAGWRAGGAVARGLARKLQRSRVVLGVVDRHRGVFRDAHPGDAAGHARSAGTAGATPTSCRACSGTWRARRAARPWRSRVWILPPARVTSGRSISRPIRASR